MSPRQDLEINIFNEILPNILEKNPRSHIFVILPGSTVSFPSNRKKVKISLTFFCVFNNGFRYGQTFTKSPFFFLN